MSTYRLRPQSPTHPRDPHRASTGNVYSSADMMPSNYSARSSTSSTPSHASTVTYEAQPIRKTIHPDGKRTQYIVRPRHNSMNTQEVKRPLTISTARNQSPTRRGPRVSASPRGIVSAGLPREDNSRLLVPSSALVPRQHASHHQRHNSASRADQHSFDPYRQRKDPRERRYHVQEAETPKQYHATRPRFARQATEEDFSYTGPREQFARDYPQQHRRDSNSRRERTSNAYESDREYSGRRSYGVPSSSNRQLHHADRVPSGRRTSRSEYDSDPDRPNEASRRHKALRAPAILHQRDPRDDGYGSSRDDVDAKSRSHKYDDEGRRHSRLHRDSVRDVDRDRRKEYDRSDDYDRHQDYERGKDHHRRQQKARETSPGRSQSEKIATGTLGGLAAAGALKSIVGRDSKDNANDSGEEESKHRHRHRRHHKSDNDRSEEPDEYYRTSKRDESGSDSQDKTRHRRRSRRRQQDEDEDEPERISETQRPPRPRSVSRVRPDEHGKSREISRDHRYDDDYEHIEPRTVSPGENEDDRPRKVMLVEPEKKDEVKPKGILKPARQVPFPEDPNPIREGVAPLKDAKKDGGVPTNARWTKISRMLVNPEALEKANERFEERDDYVIVLRVVSKEEIQKLADKTAMIREAREQEWDKRLRERTLRLTNGHDSEHTDSDEEGHDPLAIEAAPSAPPMDLRNLSQSQEPQQYAPQTMPIRNGHGSSTLPDNNPIDNYSQNV